MTERSRRPAPLQPEFFRRLFEGAGLAVFAIDANGNVQAWNSIAREVYHHRTGREGGGPLREMFPEKDRPTFDASLRSVVQRRRPTEFRTRFEDHGYRPTEYATWMTPIFAADDPDELEYVCVWLNDITARAQLRRAMRKRERLTLLGTLAGSVAHHYNNLLCSIATSLELALNMNTMSAMRRVLRRTADATARATQLTQQLLAFAQGDYRASEMADLAATVAQYYQDYAPRLAERSIKLELDLENVPNLHLPREHLLVILENLTRNAVEAMGEEGGRLTVKLRRADEQHVQLSIADSGAGIPPEHMEHLFEPFFTTKGELAAGSEHRAGMGLAVVHGLVAEMHGQIGACNVAGGARFDIVFPIAPETSPHGEPPTKRSSTDG